MDKDCKLLINSPILEALGVEQRTLMMRLLTELLKPVWHLADYVEISGIEMEASLTQS